MTNCPKCQRPILNEGIFTSPAKFNMRCPWCQATLEVNIQPKIVTEVIKLANGEPYKPENKEPKPQILAESADFSLAAPPITGSANQVSHIPLNVENKLPISFKNGSNPQKPTVFKLIGYLYPEDETLK